VNNDELMREAKRVSVQIVKEQRDRDNAYKYGRDNNCPELASAVVAEQRMIIERHAKFRKENHHNGQ